MDVGQFPMNHPRLMTLTRKCVCSFHLQKDLIVLYDVHSVFAVDALASSHPLSRQEEEVSDPAQISEMFNNISYKKVVSSKRSTGIKIELLCGVQVFSHACPV